MARAVAFGHAEPFSAINVTPFIDVLLVLLIMLILTVPVATHKLPIDLPPRGVSDTELPHQLSIDSGGTLSWDGRTISDAELPGMLTAMQRNSATASLRMKADPETRFERFDSVLAVVKRAGIERLGLAAEPPSAD